MKKKIFLAIAILLSCTINLSFGQSSSGKVESITVSPPIPTDQSNIEIVVSIYSSCSSFNISNSINGSTISITLETVPLNPDLSCTAEAVLVDLTVTIGTLSPGTYHAEVFVNDNLDFTSNDFDVIEYIEPSLILSPPSGVYLFTQDFDFMLIVESSNNPVISGDATLDGIDVTTGLAACLITGSLMPSGQTFRCPLSGRVFEVGSHTVEVNLELSDGSIISDSVTWEIKKNEES